MPQFEHEPNTAPGYHPEFGYFCPSPRLRQSLRVAMICIAVGMSLGAIVVLALMDRRFADSQQSDQTSTFGPTDRAHYTVAQATPQAAPAPLVSEEKASTPITREGCEDAAASYLNPKCRLVRKHKTHPSRSMTTRLATIEIGHGRSMGNIAQPVSATTTVGSTQAVSGPIDPPEMWSAPSTGTSERAHASTGKRARKIHHRPLAPKGDGLQAFAYASPYVQDYRQGDMYRGGRQAINGRWGWSW